MTLSKQQIDFIIKLDQKAKEILKNYGNEDLLISFVKSINRNDLIKNILTSASEDEINKYCDGGFGLLNRLYSLQLPKMLFKYLDPERIDVLINNSIRITQPIFFNDIFETSPLVEGGLGENFSATNNISLDIENITELYKKYQLYDKFQSSKIVMGNSNDPLVMAQLIESELNNHKYNLKRSFGILSLSDTCDNILMWSHYAKNHEGFVIGFKNTGFDLNSINGREFLMPQKVVYQNELPILNLEKMINKIMDYDESIKWFGTKSSHWSYENEWRLIMGLSSYETVKINAEPLPIHLLQFDPDLIDSVILGVNMDRKIEDKIIEICNKRNIKILKAVKSLNEYALGFWSQEVYLQKRVKFGNKVDLNNPDHFE
jgi:hypothetical protein